MKNLFGILFVLLLVACSNSEMYSGTNAELPPQHVEKCKVLVVLPMEGDYGVRWKRTADWFNENLQKAFEIAGIDSSIALDIEWLDENKVNLDSLGRFLATQNKDSVVIGPLYPQNVDRIAQFFERKIGNQKTRIALMMGTDEIIRKCSKQDGFFSLAEPDITQSEMLLQQAIAYGATSVSLLVANTVYGSTFIDWFAFQAREVGVHVGGVYVYNNKAEMDSVAREVFEQENGYVICVPDNYKELPRYLEIYRESKSKAKLLFSGSAYNVEFFKTKEAEGIEGYAIGTDPESGFDLSYYARYKEFPIPGEAQLYDALMLSSFAFWFNQKIANRPFYDALVYNTTLDGDEFLAWESSAMARVLKGILNYKSFNVSGASGKLNLLREKTSSYTHSVYTHWKVVNGEPFPLEHVSTEGSKRVTAYKSSTNWGVQASASEFDSSTQFRYSPIQDRYALLVAASAGWSNYRHQADALTMYRYLKSLGMDDDHIVLIVADDLVENPENPFPGYVYDYDWEPLQEDVHIDYRLNDLEPEDIISILAGEKKDGLDQVIDGDVSGNILVFWSGHGIRNGFVWGENDSEKLFTYDLMKELLQKVTKEQKFRKLLWLVETCHAGSICRAFSDVGALGTMCIAASDENETSKAIYLNDEMHTYMTNSFTYVMMEELYKVKEDSVYIAMNDFYNYLYRNTLGSHVSVYNSDRFDNMYMSGIAEFFVSRDDF